MKRGLKGFLPSGRRLLDACYNRFPDEKGTESQTPSITNRQGGSSYNRFPDEKGTESRAKRRHLDPW